MTTITFNGESKIIATDMSIQTFIDTHNFSEKKFAIALNENFVPRSDYHSTMIHNGDRLELLTPMQGG